MRFVQKQFLKEDITALNKGNVKESSHLYKLDTDVRVGGRLSNLALPIETKHPAIIPKSSHVTHLILRHVHERVGHRGRNHMLSTLRWQYWIPHANAVCKKIIKECIVYQRLFQRPGEQKMSDLPVDRISADHPPFTYTGVDYFGPIEAEHCEKLWCHFYLLNMLCSPEVAHTLDTDSCINAIQRFICRRGHQVK